MSKETEGNKKKKKLITLDRISKVADGVSVIAVAAGVTGAILDIPISIAARRFASQMKDKYHRWKKGEKGPQRQAAVG